MRTLIARVVPFVLLGQALFGCDSGGSGGPSTVTTPPPPSATVLTPNGGETLYSCGGTCQITWETVSTIGLVDLYYSTTDGTTWIPIASGEPDDGSYSWIVPDTESTECLVQVCPRGEAQPDRSDAVFAIRTPSLDILAPNGSESFYNSGQPATIEWTSTGLAGEVNLYYSTDGGTAWSLIAEDEANDGSFDWDLPLVDSIQCLVRVSGARGAPPDDSDGAFEIATPVITVASPDGGEAWCRDDGPEIISWNTVGLETTLDIHYSTNGGTDWTVVALGEADDGSYDWAIPAEDSAQCLVRLSGTGTIVEDTSDATFTIVPPTATVLAPNGSETLYSYGGVFQITWEPTGADTVDLYYSTTDGASWLTLASGEADDGVYAWAVPATSSALCLVRVDPQGIAQADASDAVFTIATPSLEVLVPNGGQSFYNSGQPVSITWTSTGLTGTVDMEYSTNGGTDWSPVAADEVDDGSYDWDLPVVDSNQCLVRVSGSLGAPGDESDTSFEILTPVIAVSSPDGGETWRYDDTTRTITWSTVGLATTVDIHYSVNGGANWAPVASGEADDGAYVWTLPVEDSTLCLVRVSGTGTSVADTSNAVFTLLPQNRAPVADAGTDAIVYVGHAAQISGSAVDPDGDATTLSWRFVSLPGGSTSTISDPTAADTSFVPDMVGAYEVGLTASDGTLPSAEATATLTAAVNTPPVAGVNDDHYALVGVATALDGTSSSDDEGHALAYSWTVASAPGGSVADTSDPSSATPSFTPDVGGDYSIQLVVNDGYDDSAPATVLVHAVTNMPPQSDAGADQVVLLGDMVTLDGSGCSDFEVDPFTLSWSFTDTPGGSAASLDDPAAVAPTFTPDLPGTYTLYLIADDGAAGPPDEVTITVSANAAPTADAGDDVLTRIDWLVYCDGTGSDDPEGRTLSYSWTLTSQPGGSTAVLGGADTSAPWFTPDLVGAYAIELTVNDGYQDSPASTVQITAVDNFAPIADAGADTASSVVGAAFDLSGHRSWDPDNDLLDFAWSVQSAPAGSAAAFGFDATAMRPRFTTDLVGVYVISLTVNDGQVSSSPDTMTITISGTALPPTVDAGGYQLGIVGCQYIFNKWSSTDPNTMAYFIVDYDLLGTPTGPVSQSLSSSYTPGIPGNYTILASVTSGAMQDMDLFTLQALDLFEPVLSLGLDANISAVAIGDVTGDGADDLVLASEDFFTSPPNDMKLFVYTYGGGALTERASYDLPTVSLSGSAAIADVTGDGLNDVIVTGANVFYVFPQTVAGDLAAPLTYTPSLGTAECLETADLNNDGRTDVVVVPWGGVSGEGMEVFLQLPAGDLAAPVAYAIENNGFMEVCTGDLNGDGRQDAVVIDGQGGASVGVRYQTPDGALGQLRYFDPGGTHTIYGELAGDAAVGDIDGDGLDDLIVVYGGNLPSAEFAILYQQPDGKLAAPVTQTCMDIPEAVNLADVDGNGLTDIVIASNGWPASVYLQSSVGHFSSSSVLDSYLYWYWSGAFAMGDLNGDGRPDLVFGYDGAAGARIYFSK